jgi:carboxypeptidase C (cathepsin A)
MIAAYHKKLAPELMQDLAKTRAEVEHWASNEYAQALGKGDAMTPQERQAVIEQMARYTGLTKEIIDQANLRIDVSKFTHNLLLDQKIRVGRLDGRFTGPDPEGLLDTRFYDPSMTGPLSPYTAAFNNYVRAELGYKNDMPYKVFAFQGGSEFNWEWGSAEEGFADTASALRQAITKNPYMKVLVMEGYYDLATPYYAANYTMDHLDLPPNLRNNISFSTYDAGHMVYIDTPSLAKFIRDLTAFIDKSLAGGQ